MNNETLYNVLWVDDNSDDSFVLGYQFRAESLGINLIHTTNWAEAEKKLIKQFDEFSAVILDANCKMTEARLEEEKFIPKVIPKLVSICNERKQLIPWYILSAGTMSNFQFVREIAYDSHAPYEDEWGQMLFIKDVADDDAQSSQKLFEQIIRVAKEQSNNVVLYRHENVFKYLGNGDDKLIQGDARKILRKMLSILYFPAETFHEIKFEGNPLRKVMEYIFRAAQKVGLLPQECFERDNQVNLLESSRYMSGLNTKHSHLRYGEAGPDHEGRGGDTIFPEYLGNIIRAIIEFGSIDSHTNEAFPYTIDDEDLTLTENEKELFFGYVLQLCHIIKFFGNYVDTHNDISINKSMITKILDPSDYEEIEGVVETDGSNYYCDKCVLLNSAKRFVGERIKLSNVRINTNRETKGKYPFFARFELINK